MRVHDHLSGRYRDSTHSNCNLNYRDSHCIPVVFHNLSGYDAHFIIKEIAVAYKGCIDLLSIIKEKYIQFAKHVDSIKIDKKTLCKIMVYRQQDNKGDSGSLCISGCTYMRYVCVCVCVCVYALTYILHIVYILHYKALQNQQKCDSSLPDRRNC